jgi:hypothetical protein
VWGSTGGKEKVFRSGNLKYKWKVLKCGAVEEGRRSVVQIVWKMGEALHRVKKKRNILHTIKRRKAQWIGHVLRKNTLLKDRKKER